MGRTVSDETEGVLDDAKTAVDPDGYADMTKAELYERATKLDIDGRSGMSKAELLGGAPEGPRRLMGRRDLGGVLVVGGGYAGVHTARSVRRAGRSTSIVDPTGRHDFVTRLAAVAGGTAPTTDASAPLSDFADEVIVGSMVAVRDGEVDLDDGTTLVADAVVVTAGAIPVSPPIDGIEHAMPLRTEGNALDLRAAIADDDAVVIIGGGATGVQLAGAVASAHPDTSVTIIDGSERLLAAMGEASGRDAARILRERDVSVRLGSEVDEIFEHGVSVDGETVDGLTVWAAGFEARADRFELPVDDDGRVLVDRFLRVQGWSPDVRSRRHRTASDDRRRRTADVGADRGTGRRRRRVQRPCDRCAAMRWSVPGWAIGAGVLDLGGRRGLAELGPVSLTAPFLDLVPPALHWGIDVKHLIETRGLAGFADRPHP